MHILTTVNKYQVKLSAKNVDVSVPRLKKMLVIKKVAYSGGHSQGRSQDFENTEAKPKVGLQPSKGGGVWEGAVKFFDFWKMK